MKDECETSFTDIDWTWCKGCPFETRWTVCEHDTLKCKRIWNELSESEREQFTATQKFKDQIGKHGLRRDT